MGGGRHAVDTERSQTSKRRREAGEGADGAWRARTRIEDVSGSFIHVGRIHSVAAGGSAAVSASDPIRSRMASTWAVVTL
eukprot:6656503-Prymnesium_polylepis.2